MQSIKFSLEPLPKNKKATKQKNQLKHKNKYQKPKAKKIEKSKSKEIRNDLQKRKRSNQSTQCDKIKQKKATKATRIPLEEAAYIFLSFEVRKQQKQKVKQN